MGTVIRRYELTDAEWKRLQEYFPDRQAGDRGRPRKDSRQILNGILWIARSGADKTIANKMSARTIQCRACGRTVVATNNRQKYCTDAECQLFRKMKNKRAFDERMRKQL